jgi:hypothetical protein
VPPNVPSPPIKPGVDEASNPGIIGEPAVIIPAPVKPPPKILGAATAGNTVAAVGAAAAVAAVAAAVAVTGSKYVVKKLSIIHKGLIQLNSFII